jgi:hypothetical protein
MLQHTAHSAIRSAQRGLSNDGIEYVYQFGSRYHRAGALIYFLRRQDVPSFDQRVDWVMCLVGTALVVAKDGSTLLTAWRNRRKGLKSILKKRTYDHGLLQDIEIAQRENMSPIVFETNSKCQFVGVPPDCDLVWAS